MSLVIKGYIGKKLFSKEDFKIYGFHPNNEYVDKLSLSNYGNITIKGQMPEMIDGKEYELELDYEKKGERESYVVKRILNNPMQMSSAEAFNFLSGLVGDNTAQNILSVYPNFIKTMVAKEYDKIDVNEIKGIGNKRLNIIKEKIEENISYFNIMSEYKDYELTLSQIKKIHDAFRSFDVLKQNMDKNPYKCLCSIAGIGFKIADAKILNKNRSLITSTFRMAECIMYVLRSNETNGHTWIKQQELYLECSNNVSECMAHFKTVLETYDMIYYNEKSKQVAIKQTYFHEKEVAQMLLEFTKKPRIIEGINFEKYASIDGFNLTKDQQMSIKYASLYNLYILAGYAGSGKTFSTKALIQMLDDNHLSYLLLAPTGKASKNLALNTDREAKTIHRGLGFKPPHNFTYNKENKLPHNFVIVDEATMIDIKLMKMLLEAIDVNKTKLVFICDPAQIPSVGCGNCIQDIINSKMFSVIMLDKVFRYEDGGLAKVATETRKGKKFLQTEGVNKLGDDFVFVPATKENMVNRIMSAYKKLEEKGGDVDDIIIISAYNKGELGTYKINAMIQDYVNPNGRDLEMSYMRDKVQITFRVNDRVMQTVNNYEAIVIDDNGEEGNYTTTEIFNGDDGKVVDIYKDKKGEIFMVVDFNGMKIKYDSGDIKTLLLAYSISAHKSQGSGYKYVIAITPPTHKFFLNRNLLYVMYTRTKKFIYNIGTIDTIEAAIKKSENMSRQTFLQNMIICQ